MNYVSTPVEKVNIGDAVIIWRGCGAGLHGVITGKREVQLHDTPILTVRLHMTYPDLVYHLKEIDVVVPAIE